MNALRYLQGYPEGHIQQVQQLIDDNKLGLYLKKKYPLKHEFNNDKALYAYTLDIKKEYLKRAPTPNKVIYDKKIEISEAALGLHTYAVRQHGNRLRGRNEIRISPVFKNSPEEFLRMIVVHELAHLKEKQHDKAFFKLCCHMEPSYHQFEFDSRLYLMHLELFGELY